MQPRSPKLLYDIREAADFIRTSTRSETLETFRTNRILYQSVERNFEIIGEAMNRLRRHDPATASLITHVDEIVGFRNVLIHGYDIINRETVWKVVQEELDPLIAEVDVLLAAAPDDEA